MSRIAAAQHEPPRRALTDRQAKTVDRLTAAAVHEVRVAGYEGLTVRGVARRAGVAPATAYTYFASKEHLVTETFWRRLRAAGDPHIDHRRSVEARVSAALAPLTQLAADEPHLAAACTVAMVVDDPDVRHLRDRVGAEIHRRFVAALGPDAPGEVVDALDLAMAGAMIRAGTGHMSYDEIPGRMARVARLLLEDWR